MDQTRTSGITELPAAAAGSEPAKRSISGDAPAAASSTATSAWTPPRSPWSRSAATSTAGPASTSGCAPTPPRTPGARRRGGSAAPCARSRCRRTHSCRSTAAAAAAPGPRSRHRAAWPASRAGRPCDTALPLQKLDENASLAERRAALETQTFPLLNSKGRTPLSGMRGVEAREELQLLDLFPMVHHDEQEGEVVVHQEEQETEPDKAAAVQEVGANVPVEAPAMAAPAPARADKMRPVLVDKARFSCSLCSGFLKRPIYQCAAGHMVCCSCRFKFRGNGCRRCGDRGVASVYTICPGLGYFFGGLQAWLIIWRTSSFSFAIFPSSFL
ncbi:hypothetical protein EJB05_29548, partial [Eragrostis curvula]